MGGKIKDLLSKVYYVLPLAISPAYAGKIVSGWCFRDYTDDMSLKERQDLELLRVWGGTLSSLAILGLMFVASNKDINKKVVKYNGSTISYSSEFNAMPMIFPTSYLVGEPLIDKYGGEFSVTLPKGETCEFSKSKGIDGVTLKRREIGKAHFYEVSNPLIEITNEGGLIERLETELENLEEPNLTSQKSRAENIKHRLQKERERIKYDCKHITNGFIGETSYRVSN